MADTRQYASPPIGAGPYDDPTVATAASAHPPTQLLIDRWARDAAFHAVGLLTSILGFTLWVTGVSVSLSLAITVMGLIATLASFYAFRWRLKDAVEVATQDRMKAERLRVIAEREARWARQGLVSCSRCGGEGGAAHWPGFDCFDCGGRGAVEPKGSRR